MRLIDVNRTCKVTKVGRCRNSKYSYYCSTYLGCDYIHFVLLQGGQVIKYTAMLACGNYNGVIGFAKAKAPAVPIALQKVSISL